MNLSNNRIPITTDVLMKSFNKDLGRDRYEIVVGQSKGLRMMSRWAPGFIFKQLNKTFSS